MLKITKKATRNFWHSNGLREMDFSTWQITLNETEQNVILIQENGAPFPKQAVPIGQVIVVDETDSSVEETFTTTALLRARLIELGYNALVTSGGGGGETNLIYSSSSTGGEVINDNGTGFNIPLVSSIIAGLTSPSMKTAWDAKQNALTFDTTPTDGSSNPVTSNGVFDAFAFKADKTQAFKKIVKITNSATTTSGTTETLLETISFSANEVAIGDVFSFFAHFKKTNAIGIVNVYLRASQTNFASSTIIARYQATSTISLIPLQRESLKLTTGNLLKGFLFTQNSINDIPAGAFSTSSMTIDPTQSWNLYISAQCVNGSDIINLETAKLLAL